MIQESVLYMEYEDLIKDLNDERLILILEDLRDRHCELLTEANEFKRLAEVFQTEHTKLMKELKSLKESRSY